MDLFNEEAEGDERRRPRHWHLEKSVSISHLISTGAAIVALVSLGASFDKRLSLAEQMIVSQHQDSEAFKIELKQAVRDINVKLDHLLERKI